ncbi:MAG: methyltransferase domain-containing protein [Candidatus Binatia bacterium]
MSDTTRGQVTASAAEVYDEFYLPALFQEWAPRVADAAQIQPGQRILDVACGTGVVARTLAERVGPSGSVVGLDINDGMLAVAQRKAPHLEWRPGSVEQLPFEANSFDAVTCQFALMFFDNRRKAIEEMMRVLRPGGHLVVAVWDSLEHTPGYAAVVKLLQRLFGDAVADSMRAPYVLGNTQTLRSLFAEAGISEVTITTHEGTARFPSLRSWVYTDVKGWTAADMIDEAGFDRLLAEAEHALQSFVTGEGTVAFSAPAHIVTTTKR